MRSSAARWIDTSSLARTTVTATPTACAARPSRTSRSRRSIARARASRSASAARTRESARPCSARARSSLGAQGEPGVHLRLAGGAGRLGEPLALGGVGLLVGGVVGRGEPGSRGRRARRGPGRGPPGRPRSPWRSARPRPRAERAVRAVVAELLGHGGQGRVGLVELGQRDVDPALGVEALGARAGRCRSRAARRRRSPRVSWVDASSYAAWISSRLGCDAEPPAAKWAPNTSPSRVTAVTSGRSATRARAASRSATTAVLKSRRASAGRRVSGHDTTSTAYAAWPGSPGQARSSVDAAAEQQPGPAEVTGLEVADRRDGGVAVGDGHGVGGRAQRRGDRGLVAGCRRSARRRPSRAGPETESEAASSAPAPSLRLSPSSRASLRAWRPERSRSACAASSRALASRSVRSSSTASAASCSASRPSSPASSPAIRVSRAVKSCWARSARATAAARDGLEPADLLVGRGGARLDGVDLAGEPGQTLAPVGGGAQEPGDPALLLGRRLLGGTTGGHRRLERGPVRLDLARRSPTPARGSAAASASSSSGSRPRSSVSCSDPAALRTRSAASDAVPRSRSRMPGQPEPGLLRPGQRRAGRRAATPRAGASDSLRLRDRGLDLLAPLDQDRLVGELLLERGAGGDQVVGDQPGAGVADVGLRRRRPCGRPRPGGPAA